MDRHAEGILLISLSAVAYSSAWFFTRLINLDAWTMLFWLGLFAGPMILCVIVVHERRNASAAMRANRSSRPRGGMLLNGRHDPLHQCVPPLLGGRRCGDLRGSPVHHCRSRLVVALMMLIIRQHHETPMLPAACLSALLCPLLVWPFAAPFEFSPPPCKWSCRMRGDRRTGVRRQ